MFDLPILDATMAILRRQAELIELVLHRVLGKAWVTPLNQQVRVFQSILLRIDNCVPNLMRET